MLPISILISIFVLLYVSPLGRRTLWKGRDVVPNLPSTVVDGGLALGTVFVGPIWLWGP